MSENVIKICLIILILGQIFECKNKIMKRLKCEGINHENTVIRNLKNPEPRLDPALPRYSAIKSEKSAIFGEINCLPQQG